MFLGGIGVRNGTVKFLILVVDTTFTFILIPASYICNTEKVKNVIAVVNKFRKKIDNGSVWENLEINLANKEMKCEGISILREQGHFTIRWCWCWCWS